MTLDAHGDLQPGDDEPASGLPHRSGSTIWTEPLTESESRIIENVLAGGTLIETRRWLAFCYEVLSAQARMPA